MPSLADLCRADIRTLTAALTPVAQDLASSDAAFAARLAERAEARGHEDALRTLTAQAAALALVSAIRAELDGDAGASALAVGGPAAAASACRDRRYADDLASVVIGACDEPVSDQHVARIAARMRAAGVREVIGGFYEEAVSQAERRQLGQFWTPEPIARLMARWAIRRPTDSVLDPAAGAGALVLPALVRLAEVGATHPERQIATNDVDPLPRALLLTSLAAHFADDFAEVALEDALAGRRGRRYDAIVANPPYTRHHHLPEAYKEVLRERFAAELGIRTSGFMSLFGHFFLHALTILAPHGRMAFITPAELLDAAYAKPIKAHVLESVNLRAVIFFGDDIDAFPGVDTAGTITLTEGGPCDGADIVFVELSAWPGEETILEAVAAGRPATHPWGEVVVRSRAELAGAGKWVVPAAHRPARRAGTVPLSEICKVMRGIATGNNDYFTLSDAERAEWGVEGEFLLPVVIKTRDWMSLSADPANLERLRAAGKKAWLFYCQRPESELAGTRALDYIRHGEVVGVPAGKLISLKSVWFQLERRRAPEAIYTYLSRGWPRFIRNDVGAQNLNGFHSVYLPEQIRDDEDLRDAFLAVLNSQATLGGLRAVGRSYGGGTVKVEPSELASLPVLDPRRMPATAIRELAELFRSGLGLAPADYDRVRAETDRVIDALA